MGRKIALYNFEFEYPYAFILLLLIICIYKCPLSIKKIIFPHTQLFVQKNYWFHKEKLFYSLILTLLITALASPITYDAKSAQKRKGRDLVFTIDTSGSMGESGFSRDNSDASKFDVVKKVISNFITHRYDDNIGVTVFGSYAFASIPLTYDMEAVTFLLNFLEVGIAGENTAIGDGINTAIDLLKKGEAKSKVIVLLTDGYQNSGSIKIKDAIERAKKEHIKIYTIGLGSEGSYDAALLKRIAQDTGARMFKAQDASQLQDVYSELDRLEPSAIRSQHYLHKQMLFTYPLTLAILLLLYLLSKRRVNGLS